MDTGFSRNNGSRPGSGALELPKDVKKPGSDAAGHKKGKKGRGFVPLETWETENKPPEPKVPVWQKLRDHLPEWAKTRRKLEDITQRLGREKTAYETSMSKAK